MKTVQQHTTHSSTLQPKAGQPYFQKKGEETSTGFSAKSRIGGSESLAPVFQKNNGPFIQTKLTIGRPGDKYEQEADATADKVVRQLSVGSSPLGSDVVQAKCAECAEEEKVQEKKEKGIQRKAIFESNEDTPERTVQAKSLATPFVQAKCDQCAEEERLQKMEEEEPLSESGMGLQMKAIFESNEESPAELQTKLEGNSSIQMKCAACEKEDQEKSPNLQQKAEGDGAATIPSLESQLNDSRGGGSPLPKGTRSQMEGAFGADFSQVRVHTDSSAVQMNKELGAQAFTHGSDVYFNAGKYDMGSKEGQHLFAHELTHTVQQGGGSLKNSIQRNNEEQEEPQEDDFESRRQELADEWFEDANELRSAGEYADAAYAHRAALLIQHTGPENFSNEDTFEEFIDNAELDALYEITTLSKLGVSEFFLAVAPYAFPEVWKVRVLEVLYLNVDLEAIQEQRDASWAIGESILQTAPEYIFERGLPVSFQEALALRVFDLQLRHFNLEGNHVVNQYLHPIRKYLLIGWKHDFYQVWNGMADQFAESVYEGHIAINYWDYLEFATLQRQGLESLIQSLNDINTEEEIANFDNQVLKLGNVAFIQAFSSTIVSLAGLAIYWRNIKRRFAKILLLSDSKVSGEERNARILRAMRWAYENGYYGEVGAQLWRNLVENSVEIILMTIGFIIIQFIPGLNIAVDAAVLIYSGFDAVDAMQNIVSAFAKTRESKTVTELQRNSAQLATVLIGDGFRFILDVVGIVSSIRPIRGRLTQILRENPTIAEEQAVRQAIRESRSGRKATPKNEPTPPRSSPSHPELSQFCFLGSLHCPGGIPASVRRGVGAYPHPQKVPYPKGGFFLRGTTDAVYQALRRVTGKQLRNTYLANKSVWTAEFRAAYNARKARWPNDGPEVWWPRVGGGKNTGPRWQVHHRRPIDFGGDHSPRNLVALEPETHLLYTVWWNGLKYEVSKYFTAKEWTNIIGGNKNRIFRPKDF